MRHVRMMKLYAMQPCWNADVRKNGSACQLGMQALLLMQYNNHDHNYHHNNLHVIAADTTFMIITETDGEQ